MDALAALDDLRRVTVILADSDDAAARRVARGLATYLSEFPQGGERLDECLGLAAAPGERSWPELERLVERDSLITEIAAQHFAGIEPSQAAKAMAAAWRKYERQAHGADRRRGYSLEELGTLRAMFFELISLGDLPGQERIAQLLRAGAERKVG
jgi:hypothetical protein